ncbi:MAG TPA: cohesin domain-containing protein, partial [Thermoanaerobaculia bacterium]|nr:cohesin domain-containing protein [Thermoanaerobaculia bacterium]
PGQPQPPPNPPPKGIDLAPAKPPTDIFRAPTPPPPPQQPPVENQPPPGGQSSLEEESVPAEPGATGVRPAASAGGALAVTLAARATPPAAATTAESRQAARTAAVQLWLTPQSLKVAAGERFEVRIEAAASAAVSHLPLSLTFDPKVLAVEKVEAGTFLGGAGEAEVLSDGSSLPGELIIGASRLGKVPGVTGTGTLVRITFRAVAAGRSGLEFHDSTALGAGLKALTLATRPALVEVTGDGRPERPEKNPPPAREASGLGGG